MASKLLTVHAAVAHNMKDYDAKGELADVAALRWIRKDGSTEVQKAVDFAEAGTWEPVEELIRFVYTERE